MTTKIAHTHHDYTVTDAGAEGFTVMIETGEVVAVRADAADAADAAENYDRGCAAAARDFKGGRVYPDPDTLACMPGEFINAYAETWGTLDDDAAAHAAEVRAGA